MYFWGHRYTQKPHRLVHESILVSIDNLMDTDAYITMFRVQ